MTLDFMVIYASLIHLPNIDSNNKIHNDYYEPVFINTMMNKIAKVPTLMELPGQLGYG